MSKTPKYWNWKGDGRSVINEENLRRFLGVSKILFPPGAKDKQIEFTVTKLYPFLLNNQNFNNSKDQQELPF